MVDFQKLYRKCSRANLLGKSCHELQHFLDKSGSILTINEHAVSSFKSIEGYAVQTDACRAFFPKQTVAELRVKESSRLYYIREQCLKVDFVTPPFMQNQFLGEFAKAIETGSDLEKVAEEFAPRMYGLEGISALSVEIYRKNSDFTKYSSQINESIEAFYLGLNRVAITSLMPCIEGIIRDIGIKIGISCEEHVNVKQFVNILKKIQQRIITNLVFYDFDWVPSDFKSISLHDGFNEQIQMVESLKYYLNNGLYQHTASYQGSTNLNRNGVVHGFITDFSSPVNFYRLITVLNMLYVCSVLTGNNGSLFYPPTSDESKVLEKRLASMIIFQRVLNGNA
jgi:hypothetical protein